MSTTNHDEYWKQVKADSVECVEELFDEGGAASLADVLGHARGMTCWRDARNVLAYVMKHGDAYENACAILALGDWLHACNELHEHNAQDAQDAGAEKASSTAAGAEAK